MLRQVASAVHQPNGGRIMQSGVAGLWTHNDFYEFWLSSKLNPLIANKGLVSIKP